MWCRNETPPLCSFWPCLCVRLHGRGRADRPRGENDRRAEAAAGAKDAHIRQLEGRIRKIEKTPQGDIVGPPSAPRAAQGVADRSAVSRAVEAPAYDDDELDRALERTLVREGALVLPPWVSELTPQFSYAHWDKVQNPYVRNSYTAALGYRLGLPWGFQVSAGLPYTYSEFRDGTSNSGLGDAGFLLSKELFLESSWTPNLVGSVGWTSPTSTGSGNTTTPIPYVSGFQAGLTASKRLDPLVVFGSVSYFSSAARDIAAELTLLMCWRRGLAVQLPSVPPAPSLPVSILLI